MDFHEKQDAAHKIVQQQKALLEDIKTLASAQARAGDQRNQQRIDALRSQYDAKEKDRIAVFQDEIDSEIADRCVAALGNRFAE